MASTPAGLRRRRRTLPAGHVALITAWTASTVGLAAIRGLCPSFSGGLRVGSVFRSSCQPDGELGKPHVLLCAQRTQPLELAGDPRALTRTIVDSRSAADVLAVVKEEVSKADFNHIHAGAAYTTLAKHRHTFSNVQGSPVLQELLSREEDFLRRGQLDGRQVANVFWAVARLENQDPGMRRLLPALIDAAKLMVDDMIPQNLANCFLAAVRLRLDSEQLQQLLPVLTQGVLTKLQVDEEPDAWDAQGVSNIFWAVAKLRAQSDAAQGLDVLVQPLATKAIAKMEHMLSQGTANMAWAAGVMKMQPAQNSFFFQALSTHATSNIHSFGGQEIANLCWGFSVAGFLDPYLMKAAAKVVTTKARELPARSAEFDLPQIVCSFAKLKVLSRKMMASIEARLPSIIPRMNDWGLCALAWSYAEMYEAEDPCKFRQLVYDEVERRGFTWEQVNHSQFGPESWEDVR